MARTRVVCVSHKEDADGVSSASLIRKAFGGETKLVDYPGLMNELEALKNDEKLKTLYICDLGLSKSNQDQFVELLKALRKNKVSITYIDHHDIEDSIKKKIKALKVKLIHTINECTTVQVYNAFKSKLSDYGSFLAACAAVTDYMEDRPIGAAQLQRFDRQFVLLEATVLTFTITSHQKDPEFLLYLVDELSESKYPHQINNTFEFARIQAERISGVIQKVKDNMKKMKNLSYMEVTDSGASMAVNFVLGLSGKEVGVSYKLREEQGIYAVSVRGAKSCKVHLGRIVNQLATELGGSGGGHDKACGAVIPKEKIGTFLKKFNSKLK
ncbi:Phosphoesterase [Candidatus Nitrosotalea sp. FS]|uniref:DHHA1 domain-containing protein n=1 Tax=Candidatus Nitrosotalea sp. FS TaxID=2341021 RepID=UPI00140B48A6|nr:DHHA1 domain-containing protein [Candidatus Nitrosotalea sp. FS]NHH97608.1 Phosphoesterase [Candidatus Nitrosotalea sp. FS]